VAGCNRQPASPSVAATKQADPTEEMVEAVRETLRKPADINTCRRLVEQLNVYLGRSDRVRKPEPLSPADRTALVKEYSLVAEKETDEVAEVARPEFTPLDAHYLDETLLYRDVARALDVDRLPPVDRATAALAWVVRNFRSVPASGPALPPTQAAQRGTGTPLERTYALLTLLRQLDVDACLIADGNTAESVWAVGVLADGQVYVFDARLGLPLPAPDGKGVATLAQLRGSPEPFKALAIDPKLPYDITPERAKKSQVFLSVPMTSLSPRMRFLQSLTPDRSAQLAADVPALRDRFRKALAGPELAGVEVGFWNPPPPADALPRLLYSFLPPNEGGGDRSNPGRMRRYYFEDMPWDRLPPYLAELQGEPGTRIRSMFAGRVLMLAQPGSPRELIHRGRFDAATEQLVALRAQLVKRPYSMEEAEGSSREWSKTASQYYADLARAERRVEKGDTAAIADRDEALRLIDILWKGSRGPVLVIEYVTSDALLAEATFLLGLCKHEQAARQRNARRGTPDPAAWQSAMIWWNQFINTYPASPAAPAARLNLAFALEGAGKTREAKAAFAALAESGLSPLEKMACRYRESQLK
jgi:hypothetical protein